MKILNFNIKGLRGIKGQLGMKLDSKSILLYGDNGAGKSSITDSFEWFFYDRVEHLAYEEIGRKGLRNILLPIQENAFIDLEFTATSFNSKKSIFLKGSNLEIDNSNSSQEFQEFLTTASQEMIILRHSDLSNFVIASKKEKLDELSRIIGYEKISDLRACLKKVLNELKREIKIRNFDNQISQQQSHLMEQLKQNIVSEEQFISAINTLLIPTKQKISSMSEIDSVLEEIRTAGEDKNLTKELWLNRISDNISNQVARIDEIENSYKEYEKLFTDLTKNIEKTRVESLLSAALFFLKNDKKKEDICPICLQTKKREVLIQEIECRVQEFKEFSKQKNRLEEIKKTIQSLVNEEVAILAGFIAEEHFKTEDKEIQDELTKMKASFEVFNNELKIGVGENCTIKAISAVKIDKKLAQKISTAIENIKKTLQTDKSINQKIDIHTRTTISNQAFLEVQKLKKEKDIFDKQIISIDAIYTDFVKKQKEAIENFIFNLSSSINEFYTFMNPGENIEDIRLVPIEKDGELLGLNIEFLFYKQQETPPQKCLSESHLNCLGLAFFLASVKAFNRQSKFFILDDIISSYDSQHRKRFADLLNEKFSDYQIILLTHEKNWFDYLNYVFKNKGWLVKVMKFDELNGARIEEEPQGLRKSIEDKLKNGDISNLANDIRIYLEHRLKEIVFKCEIKLKYMYNDKNEDRMCYELLTELKGQLKKQSTDKSLYEHPVIERLINGGFINNKGSHDSRFNTNIADLRAVWTDINEFESLFTCSGKDSCCKIISMEFYDEVNKEIRCKCGQKKYGWRK
ncbi:MAG: hypothetical protein WC549_07500 [Actinomycetota bacterium]